MGKEKPEEGSQPRFQGNGSTVGKGNRIRSIIRNREASSPAFRLAPPGQQQDLCPYAGTGDAAGGAVREKAYPDAGTGQRQDGIR